ncbi:hypothetical protein BAY61_19420 [Prauserella marina]|uniref:Act minimal PKS ketosynthase (KS/KS alpha) n=1 Tax=Prauserella marina TaxID=530584 RepID=A0A222VS80_9PSEU|nr:beta-ketoacyl synthase N-terminal-like domain-containing protein [Prauserella marina]ASR36805.1 hypothetical protein BAY61_19420 [Prauserella marina]PWV80288.1 act minimal PKS ketosynthase (KS/KS alpha) [Prauserella marina]SDD51056.1 act minimal PKS ketosynthase (KS/KS alpha) [Prauserella marina]
MVRTDREGVWKRLGIRGVGMVLPGVDRSCRDVKEFAGTVLSGRSAISPLDLTDSAVRVAGRVPEEFTEELDLPDAVIRRTPRAGRLAHAAVVDAMDNAGLTAREISDGRAVLILTSLQFSVQEVIRLMRRFDDQGPSGVGMRYWATATPGAIASMLCMNLGLDIPTFTLTGGCSVSLRGFELGANMVARGEVEHAIVVGVETPLEPLFLSSTAYQTRTGHRASSTSADPSDVRPHDEVQTGNAPAEGAMAFVLGPATEGDGNIEVAMLSSRNGGNNAMGLGDPVPYGRDLAGLLRSADVTFDDLACFCDFAEGNRELENFLCDTVDSLRDSLADDSPLYITSQEACYGHLPGAVGLLKVLSGLVMLDAERIAPTANLVTPYKRLPATPVVGEAAAFSRSARPTVLTAALSGGGDTTSVLLRTV